MIDASKSIAACAEYYGDDSHLVRKYLIEGEKKALSINNRGSTVINRKSFFLTLN